MTKYKYGRDARWTGEADIYTSGFSGTEKQRKESEKVLAALLSGCYKSKKKAKHPGTSHSKHSGRHHGSHRSGRQ